ncbi:MAG TPA: NlpC/P60 family protein [Gaiellaceae bacterium]|jgi:hypothetical protein|nr:NlpC/P60 family protein [Gaiellaceae bacterium]
MPALRSKIVSHANWGVRNRAQIHYLQLRPIDGIGQPRKLPLSTDCSGWVTDCYNWAGAADPNGRNYDGQGFTGTLLAHCKRIDRDDLKLGDLVVFGPGDGDHVVLIATRGADPVVVSLGSEPGPIRLRLSQEAAYHRPPIRYLNGLAERPDYVPPPARELHGAWNPPTESEELVAAAIEDE